MSEAVLRVDALTKTFPSGGRTLTVIDDVSFAVDEGDTCAIVGPSGSGKTTLLGLCAGLDQPTSGRVELCGRDLTPLDEDERAEVRNRNVGFVFQTFRLLPTLTALENVMVPAELRGDANPRPRAAELLDEVGLGDRLDHYPSQLSGGEQQRVAMARAFINRPRVLFADEPTGNLDAETAGRIEDLLFELNETAGTTLVLVSHDQELAAAEMQNALRTGGQLLVVGHQDERRPRRLVELEEKVLDPPRRDGGANRGLALRAQRDGGNDARLGVPRPGAGRPYGAHPASPRRPDRERRTADGRRGPGRGVEFDVLRIFAVLTQYALRNTAPIWATCLRRGVPLSR